jgi:hypothetical protein
MTSASIGIDRSAAAHGRIPGDADGDGALTPDDRAYIEQRLHAQRDVPGSGYDAGADLNANGVIDPGDLVVFELIFD